MKLIERHIIGRNHSWWKACDDLCFKSKNLYNYALYVIKTELESSGKWIRYNDLERQLRTTSQIDYVTLPNNSSQQILMLLDKNFKSYFKTVKTWKRDKTRFFNCPKLPFFKHKTKGRNIAVFTYAQLWVKDGYIKFPKKSGLGILKTKVEKLKQVRVIPQRSCYTIEVVYEKLELTLKQSNNNFLSIDLGVNNLTTCVDTVNKNSFIVNGRPLKAINHYYNRKLAKIKSQLQKNHNKKSSKKLNKLTLKRNNKVSNYLHHTSKLIVNHCVNNNINTIVIGKNDFWKQEVNLGKKNNQNFVQIPFNTLISQIEYKSQLQGISVLLNEESYTSKCSALDLEPIYKHDNYLGRRIKRGLFKSSKGLLINADINGSLNILRKATGDNYASNLISTGCVAQPIKVLPL